MSGNAINLSVENGGNSVEGEFLQRLLLFCANVDAYMKLLQLDEEKVWAFKNEQVLIEFMLKNRDHFGHMHDEDILFYIQKLEAAYEDLAEHCKSSPNYTADIGMLLGLEKSRKLPGISGLA